LRLLSIHCELCLRSLGAVNERRVSLFRIGRNQADRIPREFELPGKDAVMRKERDRLIIEAEEPKSLLAVLANLAPLDDAFPPIPELDFDPVEL
jgi:antitoxin VapB